MLHGTPDAHQRFTWSAEVDPRCTLLVLVWEQFISQNPGIDWQQKFTGQPRDRPFSRKSQLPQGQRGAIKRPVPGVRLLEEIKAEHATATIAREPVADAKANQSERPARTSCISLSGMRTLVPELQKARF